jgi:hypothetical protein
MAELYVQWQTDQLYGEQVCSFRPFDNGHAFQGPFFISHSEIAQTRQFLSMERMQEFIAFFIDIKYVFV